MADLTEHYKTLYEAQSRRLAKDAFQVGYLARWLHEETDIPMEAIMSEANDRADAHLEEREDIQAVAPRDCAAEEVPASD